jgi:hypothetical protein
MPRVIIAVMRPRTLSSGGRGLENARGAIGVWARAPILLAQMIGYGDGRFADPIIAGFDELAIGKLPIHIFFEMGAMENYDSALRTRLTSHFSQHRGKIAALNVFTRSKLVAMGVSVANLALGGLITSHANLAAFQAALDRKLSETRVSGLGSAVLNR